MSNIRMERKFPPDKIDCFIFFAVSEEHDDDDDAAQMQLPDRLFACTVYGGGFFFELLPTPISN